MGKLISTPNSYALAVCRFLLGAVMFAHGAQKMLGWFGGPGLTGTMTAFESGGIPAPFAVLAIMAEFLGGLGLIVGFLSRIAAFGILCNMIVAIARVHSKVGFFMNWTGKQQGEGFEYHLLAIAIALTVIIGGAGALSIDRLLTRSRRTVEFEYGHRPVRPARV